METRFQTGTVASAIGHTGLILWVLVGDWLFAASVPPEPIVMSVSMISSEEFDALQAAATPEPAEEPAPVRPAARPEEVVEPAPEPAPEPEPEPIPEPEPVPEPEPEPEPLPEPEPPPSDAPQAEEEQALQSESVEIQPAPEAEEIVAPDPVQPETEAETSDTPEPAVAEDPAAEEVVPEEPTEATVAEDTGDVTQTEANEEQEAETGMTTSLRPKSRPDRPEPEPEPETEVASAEPEETEPETSAELNVQPVDDTETQDAIDALLGEATEEPVEEPVETGGQDLPQGPPLTGGEMGDIKRAIGSKWNLGTASTDALGTTIMILVTFSPEGAPVSIDLMESDGPTQAATDTAFGAARRAVLRAHQEGGIPLPRDKYDTWREIEMVFDPNGMRLR
jgi:hypothetical protein